MKVTSEALMPPSLSVPYKITKFKVSLFGNVAITKLIHFKEKDEKYLPNNNPKLKH